MEWLVTLSWCCREQRSRALECSSDDAHREQQMRDTLTDQCTLRQRLRLLPTESNEVVMSDTRTQQVIVEAVESGAERAGAP